MRRNLRGIVTASVALLAVACALGPDYQRPKEKIPAAYRFEPAAGNDSFADQGWWQLYQDPTLQSLIREALDNNLDVRIAAARIDQARDRGRACRAARFPIRQAGCDGGAGLRRRHRLLHPADPGRAAGHHPAHGGDAPEIRRPDAGPT